MEAFLKKQQEFTPPVVQNVRTHRRTSSEIELAMAGYFDASAEASEMCLQLLRNLEAAQSSYRSMDMFLASMADDTCDVLALNNPFPYRINSFYTATRSNFRQIHHRYSSTFQSIRLSHRKVARKLKTLKAVKKLLTTCLLAACGAAAAVAIGAAPHLMFLGLLVGPASTGLCPIALRKQTTKKKTRSTKTGSLLRLQEQLDAAVKGTYVLGRDLDTVSDLVARLSDCMERENAMAMCCVERVGERRSVLEMVRELRKSCSNSRRLAEELEEHVCLCLATIHKARVLVIQEISKQE